MSSDPLNIFVVAEQFWSATRMLRREQAQPSSPPIVCAAFALELYLKCLIAMEPGKNPPPTHNLEKLFRLLGAKAQSEIRTEFTQHEREAEELASRAYAARGTNRPPGPIFDFILKASRDAFQTHRYIYENGLEANRGWGADRIMQAARNVILDRHPEWEGAHQVAP